MALIAMAAPILPGKEEQWRQFMSEIQGPRYDDFKASRDRLGVLERTFLQHTPMGDMVIITLEGNDPLSAFQKIASSQDPFMNWFIQQVKEIHGFDLRAGLPGEPPQLVMHTQDRQGMKLYTQGKQSQREAA